MPDYEAIRAFEHRGWEKAASSYEGSFAAATRQFVPALLDAARISPGKTVLDIACGPGFAAAAAAERGATARGLDFSPAMLAQAQVRYPKLSFDQGDAEALPYKDGAFDAVVSNFGIHHVPQPILALRQALRVLHPGGSLAFTIWAAPGENTAWKLVFDAVRHCGDMAASKAPAPGGAFGSPQDCAAALQQAGFSAIATTPLTAMWRHQSAADLIRALRSGTARMAALIEAQPAAVIDAMTAEIERRATPFRTGEMLEIPIAAFVAVGRRPEA